MRELEHAAADDMAKNRERTIVVKFRGTDTSTCSGTLQRYLRKAHCIERGCKHFYEQVLYALPTHTMTGSQPDHHIAVRDNIPLTERDSN